MNNLKIQANKRVRDCKSMLDTLGIEYTTYPALNDRGFIISSKAMKFLLDMVDWA